MSEHKDYDSESSADSNFGNPYKKVHSQSKKESKNVFENQ